MFDVKRTTFLVMAGFLYAAGTPTSLGFEFFLAPTIGTFMVMHLLLRENHDLKFIYFNLLFFFLGANLLGYPWLPFTFREFGSIPFPLDYLGWISFSLIILPQFYIFFLLDNAFKKFHLYENFAKGFRPYLYILFWLLSEAVAPQQFATYLGHPWLQIKPFLFGATISGVPLYSLLSSILIFLSLEQLKKAKPANTFIKMYSPLLIFCLLTLVVHIANPLKLPTTPSKQLNIRIVQGNIGNFLKIDSETGNRISIFKVFDIFKRLSLRPSEEPLDLIIWPETAFPEYQFSEYLKQFPQSVPFLIKTVTKEAGAELYTGGYDYKDPNSYSYFENIWNSGFLFSRSGKLKQVYHKHILIPFGETLPFGPLTKPMSKIVKNISYFAKGSEFSLFTTENGSTFINPICYEVLVESFIRKYLNSLNGVRPDFILNVTNDSWYGKSNEPYQHKFLAHWRAVEHQMPIVRSTNTGVTSVLYEDGTESKSMPWYTEDVLDLTLNFAKKPKTIYQTWGHIPLMLTMVILTLLGFITSRKDS